MHQPDFGGNRLRAGLMIDEGASAESFADCQVDPGGAPRGLLRRAREQFGPRFFVSPESVCSLWQRIGDKYPQWRERHLEAVRADTAAGISIYSRRGPRMGKEFPWDDLPIGPHGDSLYAKHLHRFAFVARHALACFDDSTSIDRLESMLETWVDCARARRSHYCYDSNLGVIQRLLVLSWAWVFLSARGADGNCEAERLEWRVLRIIESDIRFLEPRLGESAPNNHLLADRFAAWYLRAVFPELVADGDCTQAENEWKKELLRQTYADGGSFEQSMHYHESVCEMVAAYLILCRRQGRAADPEIEGRARSILRFQTIINETVETRLPIGNGAEESLFPLDPGQSECTGALREIYRTLFDPQVPPAPMEDVTVMRSYWMLGGDLAHAQTKSTREPRMVPFADSGLYVFTDVEKEARLVFRTGPRFGVQVAPGHMHADLLSIYVRVNGEPLIVDAGTYTYRLVSGDQVVGGTSWRRYFAGPAAHNGLTIGDSDPLGTLYGDFRQSGSEVRAESYHAVSDGLAMVDARLGDAAPYTNVRRVCVHVHGEYWLIIDTYPTVMTHHGPMHYGFQLAQGVNLRVDDRAVTARGSADGACVTLVGSTDRDVPNVFEGSVDPLAGWVSPRYGELKPAPQVRFSGGSDDGLSCFFLRIGVPDVEQPEIRVVPVTQDVFAVHVDGNKRRDVLLYGGATSTQAEIRYDGLSFKGRCMWLRREDDGSVDLRTVGASHVRRYIDGVEEILY